MAAKVDILEADRFFTNTDYTVKVSIFEADGITPRNVATYALSWLLKKRVTDLDANAVITKVTPAGITITGIFNVDPTLNTQIVEIPLADTDTLSVRHGAYHHELKRTDAGFETVLCSGMAILKASAHRL